MPQETIPERAQVAKENTWDLSRLFINDEEWEKGLAQYTEQSEKIPSFIGTLGKSAENLEAWLKFCRDLGILEERLSYYANLRQSENEGDNDARTMTGKFTIAYSKVHLRDEEELQIECGFPRYGEHKLVHSKFLSTVDAFQQEFERDGPSADLCDRISKALVSWLIKHINTEDRLIGEHIAKTGYKG